MRFIFLFFIVILIAGTVSANSDSISYFRKIYQAEKHVLNSTYDLALKAYQNTLSIDGMANDYLNAGFCALMCKNDSIAISYFEIYLKRGGALSRLSDAAIKKIFPQLNDETIKKISFLREKYTSNNPVWQHPVRAFIDSLIALDQKKHMAIVGEQKCAEVRYISSLSFDSTLGRDVRRYYPGIDDLEHIDDRRRQWCQPILAEEQLIHPERILPKNYH